MYLSVNLLHNKTIDKNWPLRTLIALILQGVNKPMKTGKSQPDYNMLDFGHNHYRLTESGFISASVLYSSLMPSR